MREIDELLDLCRYAGSSPAIAQGAGGNVSVKNADGAMWIKASGYRLSDIRDGVGYLAMRTPEPGELSKSVDGLNGRSANVSMSRYLQSLVFDSTNLRPSLETWFHAVLGRVVLHTHPIYANAFACMERGREELERLLPEPLAYVEYQAPGHRLGEAVHGVSIRYNLEHGREPVQFLLENHGLIAVGKTGREAVSKSREVLDAGNRFFGPLPENSFAPVTGRPCLDAWAASLQIICRRAGIVHIVRASRFERLHGESGAIPSQCHPIVPDDAVCNGRAVMEVNHSVPADAFFADHADSFRGAVTVLVRGLGFLFAAQSESMIQAMEEQLLSNLLVRELVARRGTCRTLKQSDISELLVMESEKHRQQVLASGGNACRS